MTTKLPKLQIKSVAALLAVSVFISGTLLWSIPASAQDGPPPPPDEAGPPNGPDQHHQRGERFRRWFEDRDGGVREGEEKGGPREGGRMGRAGRFLGFVSEFNKQVQDPVQSVGLAAVGVKDYYRREGKPEEAIPVLEEMLKSAKDQGVRNVLLFAMRQIYDEAKNGEKMLELSKQIMRENIVAAEKNPTAKK